jgi:hypothetical protein
MAGNQGDADAAVDLLADVLSDPAEAGPAETLRLEDLAAPALLMQDRCGEIMEQPASGGGPLLGARRSRELGPFGTYGEDQEPEEADRGGPVTDLSSRPRDQFGG